MARARYGGEHCVGSHRMTSRLLSAGVGIGLDRAGFDWASEWVAPVYLSEHGQRAGMQFGLV